MNDRLSLSEYFTPDKWCCDEYILYLNACRRKYSLSSSYNSKPPVSELSVEDTSFVFYSNMIFNVSIFFLYASLVNQFVHLPAILSVLSYFYIFSDRNLFFALYIVVSVNPLKLYEYVYYSRFVRFL